MSRLSGTWCRCRGDENLSGPGRDRLVYVLDATPFGGKQDSEAISVAMTVVSTMLLGTPGRPRPGVPCDPG
jgi:hypothetical protein